MINSNFTNYQKTSKGSILYTLQSSIFIQGSQFINNSADVGGVIYLDYENILSISESIFDTNIAFNSSGVLDASLYCNITSQRNVFKNNFAEIQGIFNIKIRSNFLETGSIFENNTSNNKD